MDRDEVVKIVDESAQAFAEAKDMAVALALGKCAEFAKGKGLTGKHRFVLQFEYSITEAGVSLHCAADLVLHGGYPNPKTIKKDVAIATVKVRDD